MNACEPRRSTEPQISDAITLRWRIATLYSLRTDGLPSSPPDNLLPMRRSLPTSERLVLELRAAAGDAGRLGLGLEPAELDELVRLAEHAPESSAIEADFRAQIRAWHIDLQTRIDPAAVRIVKQHLECWQNAVCDRTAECATCADLDPLDSQAVVWFQLVSGDKEPEAFIDHDDRERVRGTMFSRTVGTYLRNWRFVLGPVLGLAALIALSVALVTRRPARTWVRSSPS